MSNPRHRLDPADVTVALASYPPPGVRSRDFDAVEPSRPAQYIAPRSTHSPTGDGPDQWAEEPVPASAAPESGSESDELELAHS
jgi:hypothetical protein